MNEPGHDHRDSLEAELLAAFDRRHPRRAASRAPRFAKLLAAAALVAGVFAAARAPADHTVELGQRLEVRAARLPEGSELSALVEEGLGAVAGDHAQIEVRVVRDAAGEALRVDVWGAPIAGIAERLRARVPALATAEIAVTALEGRVRTSVAGLLGHRLLKLRDDPRALEEARRELQQALAAGGHAGTVEVDVDALGRHRVRVKVQHRREGDR